MPELPEVETVRRSLKALVVGKEIKKIDVFYEKIIRNVNLESFKTSLEGQVIRDVERLGKYLIFVMDDYYLISHLRMEGKYHLKKEEIFSKHEHVVFYFEDEVLTYADTRKFGTMDLFEKSVDIYQVNPLGKVGYEPFDKRFTFEYFSGKLLKSSRAIKTALLDQSIVSGLGNIYVDEVLFSSKIHPERLAKDLSEDEIRLIMESSVKVLNKAIGLGGTTIRSFKVNHDLTGRFQNELLIHTKKECPTCKRVVLKIRVGGRGTYYCEFCQNLDKDSRL